MEEWDPIPNSKHESNDIEDYSSQEYGNGSVTDKTKLVIKSKNKVIYIVCINDTLISDNVCDYLDIKYYVDIIILCIKRLINVYTI